MYRYITKPTQVRKNNNTAPTSSYVKANIRSLGQLGQQMYQGGPSGPLLAPAWWSHIGQNH